MEERLIRKKGGSRSPSPKRGRKLREGAKVQCRYRGRSKFYPGRIERDRGDGTYDIYCAHGVYASTRRVSRFFHTDDDGEKETRVLEEYIKAEDAGSSDEERKRDDGDRGRARMRVGDRIEAKYRGRSKYYKGKISRVRADGTRVAVSNPKLYGL